MPPLECIALRCREQQHGTRQSFITALSKAWYTCRSMSLHEWSAARRALLRGSSISFPVVADGVVALTFSRARAERGETDISCVEPSYLDGDCLQVAAPERLGAYVCGIHVAGSARLGRQCQGCVSSSSIGCQLA